MRGYRKKTCKKSGYQGLQNCITCSIWPSKYKRFFAEKKMFAEARTELKNYSKMKSSVFRFDDSFEKLAEYKGIDLINDCQNTLPITYGFISSTANKKSPKTAMSKKVLALSSVLNSWIPKSKFVCRNNVILTAGGCKKPEIETFHKFSHFGK